VLVLVCPKTITSSRASPEANPEGATPLIGHEHDPARLP
jgi:hypothetical protein